MYNEGCALMKYIIYIFGLIIIFFYSSISVSQLSLQWSNLYHSGYPIPVSEEAASLCVGENGNVYVTGKTGGDVYKILKYNADGHFLWEVNPVSGSPIGILYRNSQTFVFGTGGAFRIFPDGNHLIVSGRYIENAILDECGFLYATYIEPFYFLKTSKFDSVGHTLWTFSGSEYNGPTHCNLMFTGVGESVSVLGYSSNVWSTSGIYRSFDTAGNVLFNGQSPGMSQLGIGNEFSGYNFLVASDNSSLFIYKLTSNYSIVDTLVYFGIGGNRPFHLATDYSGGIYIAARKWNSRPDHDFAVFKFNSNLELEWIYTYDGTPGGYDAALKIKFGSDGNIYASGVTTIDQQETLIRTVKLSTSGELLWSDNFRAQTPSGPSGQTIVNAMELDTLGNIYLCGKAHNKQTGRFDFLTLKYSVTSPVEQNSLNVDDYEVLEHYPNPFNPEVNLRVKLSKVTPVKVTVYDASGKFIEEIVDARLNTGVHVFKWSGMGYSSGLYFFRMETGNSTRVGKGILLK